MSKIPKPTEPAIESRVGGKSHERGERYYRQGAIFDARRQGTTLKARCEGSRAEAYRVRVTCDGNQIIDAECSCPVGGGGLCKHVAALLLTGRDHPDQFTKVEELDPSLKRRSKPELIALIKQMLRRTPDLELLLETPLPGTGKRRMPVNPETYRRQAAAYKRHADYDAYQRRAYGQFLLTLEADTLDDETYLRIGRETGPRLDLIDRLLQLGRLDEAVKEFQKADDPQAIAIADLFVSHHQAKVIEPLMEQRAAKAKTTSLWEWLRKRAVARGDTTAQQEITERLFRLQPTFKGYKELRKLTTPASRWPEPRAALLAGLQERRNSYTLIPIYLDEVEIDEAIAIVKRERGDESGLRLEVAKAAEKTRPEAAIEIYQKHGEHLIDHRSRDDYREACGYLKKVRGLFQKLGVADAWTRYVADPRERFRSLRALKEEMKKAKL